MTNNTIPNVPRELLEELRDAANEGMNATTRQHQIDHFAGLIAKVDALLSAPSPTGVDGLGDTAKLLLPALRQYMHNDGSGLLAGYDLETTQAIIDGLRGEVAKINSDRLACWAEFKVMTRACLDAEKERDQQARRIGELEGLLRATGEAGRQLSNAAYNLAQREGHELTKCECALLSSLRKQWDAALSAGKEGE